MFFPVSRSALIPNLGLGPRKRAHPCGLVRRWGLYRQPTRLIARAGKVPTFAQIHSLN